VEGTDKTQTTTQRSHAFADKNNLPRYDYVLHPRVTGFSHTMQLMSQGSYSLLFLVAHEVDVYLEFVNFCKF